MEVVAWQAVAGAGVALPDALQSAYQRTERIDAELAEANAEVLEVRNPVDAVIAGTPLDVAVDEHRTQAARRDHADAKRSTAGTASRLSRDLTAKWIGANRDLLIVEHLRPVVADIVAEAAKLAGKLEQFAPEFDGGAVAASSTPAVLAAWRDSRALDERLRLCVDAWASSWNAATLSVPSGQMAPGYLRIEEPGGVHVWERPKAVTDLDVRDGRVLEVLRVAEWHEAGGYRLASLAEVVDYTQRWQTETPWHAGEFTARRVLVPTGEPVRQPEARAEGSWATSV